MLTKKMGCLAPQIEGFVAVKSLKLASLSPCLTGKTYQKPDSLKGAGTCLRHDSKSRKDAVSEPCAESFVRQSVPVAGGGRYGLAISDRPSSLHARSSYFLVIVSLISAIALTLRTIAIFRRVLPRPQPEFQPYPANCQRLRLLQRL